MRGGDRESVRHSIITSTRRRSPLEKSEAMHENQRVAEMADEVLSRQAAFRAKRTGEPLEEAFRGVLDSRAGRYLEELRKGPHRDEQAKQWQEESARKRNKERSRTKQEERKRLEQEAAWEQFMQTELQELELRKSGQLKELLGEPLPGESHEVLKHLARQDRRQAEDGLVALMSGGELSYKTIDELCPEDMPARIAAERLRTSWLKKRQDGWLAQGEGSL